MIFLHIVGEFAVVWVDVVVGELMACGGKPREENLSGRNGASRPVHIQKITKIEIDVSTSIESHCR